ncbi:unnamed protein product [Rhizoctonia solani]|uniref:Uncharacterized protein n=1 Tax=Rhizoctonia solani TaxID=456999 RepID=A0A8H3BES9_9AGAM|nr:unnamed protein product [Rhizoctonia solani]
MPTFSSDPSQSNDSDDEMAIEDALEKSGTDTEMADAGSNVDEISTVDQDASNQHVQSQDVLESIPNLFRLLYLVDEHGSGGIRMYGNRSEIVKILRHAQYLAENLAALLSQVDSLDHLTSSLRTGLYLVLDPDHDSLGPSKNPLRRPCAAIVTFMRYLTKLADHIIALVSPSQAEAFVWDTSARNKDLPEDQQDNDDNSQLFSFEVSKSLKQVENAVGSAGFTVPVESKLLPKTRIKQYLGSLDPHRGQSSL